jgi:hypothetical protein
MSAQRKPLRKPTIKQKLAVKEIVENGSSVAAAMRKVGYSAQTAKDPGKLTRSEGFQCLMEEMGLSDDVFVTVLKEGLQATKAVVMGTKSEESFVDVAPDFPTRHKYLETGLRLKGLVRIDTQTNIQFNNYAQQQRDTYDLS